jgi:3',5'-cyclic AMP phosphodiesterase CpdA
MADRNNRQLATKWRAMVTIHPRDGMKTLGTALTTASTIPTDSPRAFTLAHLSDPHLTSLVGVHPGDLANKRILGYLSWRRRRRRVHRIETLAAVVADMRAFAPDHVVVTGDLTHVGLAEECATAAAWLRDLGPADRVSLVPGNHDRYVAADFDRTVGLWRDYFRGDDGAIGFPFVRRRDRVALIGVDTAVPTAPFLASGRIGDAQRARLERILEQTCAAGLFRVVLLHHSPLADGHSRRKRLSDAEAVTRTLTTHGAELVIHGHGHEERVDRLRGPAGPMLVVAVPSASYDAPGRAGWNQYRISGEAGAWRLDLEARRSSVGGYVTTTRETVSWSETVSRAVAPTSR